MSLDNPNSAALLTLLRFSGVAAAELEPECGLLELWVPLALFALEEEEDEDEEGAGGGGVRVWWEDDVKDEEWDGRLCDEDDDDDGFFFFLTDVGASYVRKDSKDMVGVSKSSSSSLGGESFGARGRPGNTEANGKVRGCSESWEIRTLVCVCECDFLLTFIKFYITFINMLAASN